MTLTQQRGFRALVRDLLSLPENTVRPANNGTPAGDPNLPLVTVLLVQEETNGNGNTLFSDGVGTLVDIATEGQYPITLSLQFFRENAINNAGRLRKLIVHPLVHERLMALGLGFVSSTNVRNLTALLNRTLHEERAQLDMTFNLLRREVLSVESFASVQITLNLNGTTATSEVTAP